MDKILAVARREFLATVRTKAFVLSVVLMPAIIVGAIYGIELMQKRSAQEKLPTRRIAVIDLTGDVYRQLTDQIADYNGTHSNQRFELEEVVPAATADLSVLRERVRTGELYGYVAIRPDAVSGQGGCALARAGNQLQVGEELERALHDAVVAARFEAAGIPLDKVKELREQPVPILQLDARTGQFVLSNKMARVMTPFAFMFLLFIGTFGISQGLLTTLIEEKSSRVVEVLLSAVSPTQLMAGKIIGLVLVGFILLAVWGAAGMAGANAYQARDLVTAYRLTIAVLYFVPGFLLIASLLAAVGSACNELRDAQSMVFPLSILTIIPMMFWFFLAEYPTSAFSIILSYVPPITPFVMMLRICADPDTPLWQIITTQILMWASVCAAIWAAGKVFRVGVLMYGKPPSLRELVRWVRYS